MKKILLALFVVVMGTNLAFAKGSEEIPKAFKQFEPISLTRMQEAINAYGFFLGRMFFADKLIARFPSYRNEIERAKRAAENSLCGQGAKVLAPIFQQLVSEKIRKEAIEMFNKEFRKREGQLTIDDVVWLVDTYTKGELCSEGQSFCNTLLSFNPSLNNYPGMYFELGLLKRYSTAGHQKSQGVDLQVEVPITWAQKEGRRPHVLWRFSGPSYEGMYPQLIITISDPDPDLRELLKTYRPEEIFHDDELISMIAEKLGTINSVKKTFIDQLPAVLIEYTIERERLGNKILSKGMAVIILFEDKIISVMASLVSLPEYYKDINSKFEVYRSLFFQLLNSVVVVSKYK